MDTSHSTNTSAQLTPLPFTPSASFARQDGLATPDPAAFTNLATPGPRRTNFLLDVINASSRPKLGRLSLPAKTTPHPKRFGTNHLPLKIIDTNIAATQGPQLPPQEPEVDYTFDDRASILSTSSAHDLLLPAHAGANPHMSFDPTQAVDRGVVNRFDALRLNVYLHDLNTRLTKENRELCDKLKQVQTELQLRCLDSEISLNQLQFPATSEITLSQRNQSQRFDSASSMEHRTGTAPSPNQHTLIDQTSDAIAAEAQRKALQEYELQEALEKNTNHWQKQIQDAHDAAANILSVIEKERDDATEQLKLIQNEYASRDAQASHRITSLERQLKELRDKAAANEQSHRAKEAALRAQVDAAEDMSNKELQEAVLARRQVEDMLARVKEEAKDPPKATDSRMSSTFRQLESERDDARHQAERLRCKIETLQSDLDHRIRELGDQKVQTGESKAELQEMIDKCASLERNALRDAGELKKAQSDHQGLQSENTRLLALLELLRKQQGQVGTNGTMVATARPDEGKQVEDEAQKADMAHKTIRKLETALMRVQREVDEFRKDLDRLQEEKLELEAELLRCTTQNGGGELQAELEHARGVINTHREECHGLIMQINYLQQKWVREANLRHDLSFSKHYLLDQLSMAWGESARVILGHTTRSGTRLRSAALMVVFIVRARRAALEWRMKRMCRPAIEAALEDVHRRRALRRDK